MRSASPSLCTAVLCLALAQSRYSWCSRQYFILTGHLGITDKRAAAGGRV